MSLLASFQDTLSCVEFPIDFCVALLYNEFVIIPLQYSLYITMMLNTRALYPLYC